MVMVTAGMIQRCAYLDSLALEGLIRKNYPNDVVIRSQFMGINNQNQFVYTITYPDQLRNEHFCTARICVWENGSGELVADYD